MTRTRGREKPEVSPNSRSKTADEEGFALVVVLVVMLIGIGFTVAGLASALDSRAHATRDARVRRAQQAADAGVQARLYQMTQADLGSTAFNFNGGVLGLSTLLDCVVPQLNASAQVTGVVAVTANAAGVCPIAVDAGKNAVTSYAPALGNHTTYQVESFTGHTNFLNGTVFSGQNGSGMVIENPKILAIGKESTNIPASVGPIYQRELAILAPWAPLQAIEGENNVTINGLSLCIVLLGCANLTGTLNGNVFARHNLTTPSVLAGLNLSNGLLATLAYGGSYSGGLTVANLKGPVNPASIIQRQPVTIAATKASCPASDPSCASLGSAYKPGTDTFALTSGSVTFAAGDYVFCNFSAASGTTVNVSPTAAAPVRIFIDSPSSTRCKSNGLGNAQGNFSDVAGFNNGLLGTGGVLAASGFQVYVAGDGAYDSNTSVQIGPTSTSGLLSLSAATYGAIVYAPTSAVTVNVPAACVSLLVSACTGGVFEGAAVGNDTTVTALTITQDLSIGNYPLYAGINAFRVLQYVQCDTSVTSVTGATADLNGC